MCGYSVMRQKTTSRKIKILVAKLGVDGHD